MDLIFLSKIFSYMEMLGNAFFSLVLFFLCFRWKDVRSNEDPSTDFIQIFMLIYAALIIILNFLTFCEGSGFAGRNLNRKFMIYSIVVRFIWFVFYAGTFYIAEGIDNFYIVSISTTTYGLIRLILQIYISKLNFIESAETENDLCTVITMNCKINFKNCCV